MPFRQSLVPSPERRALDDLQRASNDAPVSASMRAWEPSRAWSVLTRELKHYDKIERSLRLRSDVIEAARWVVNFNFVFLICFLGSQGRGRDAAVILGLIAGFNLAANAIVARLVPGAPSRERIVVALAAFAPDVPDVDVLDTLLPWIDPNPWSDVGAKLLPVIQSALATIGNDDIARLSDKSVAKLFEIAASLRLDDALAVAALLVLAARAIIDPSISLFRVHTHLERASNVSAARRAAFGELTMAISWRRPGG